MVYDCTLGKQINTVTPPTSVAGYGYAIATGHAMRKRLETARRPEVIRTALRFALVVGPILVFINHGDAIIAGTMNTIDWFKSGLTMIVPYTVSTLSSISAYHACRSDCD